MNFRCFKDLVYTLITQTLNSSLFKDHIAIFLTKRIPYCHTRIDDAVSFSPTKTWIHLDASLFQCIIDENVISTWGVVCVVFEVFHVARHEGTARIPHQPDYNVPQEITEGAWDMLLAMGASYTRYMYLL